jgi:uncharacterized cupredoxin-like copper-binding protein
MHIWRFFTLVSTVALVLVATACSSTPSEPPVRASGQFTMRVDNTMQFGTRALAVKAGQPLELTLENVGGMPHDFSISQGAAEPVKIEAQPGESARGAFTIDKPGTYEFVCNQPAHALAGMRGTIVAE